MIIKSNQEAITSALRSLEEVQIYIESNCAQLFKSNSLGGDRAAAAYNLEVQKVIRLRRHINEIEEILEA